MVREPGVQLLHGGEQAGHRHRRRALDVVVERAVLIAVLLQETERVVVAEVFKLSIGDSVYCCKVYGYYFETVFNDLSCGLEQDKKATSGCTCRVKQRQVV